MSSSIVEQIQQEITQLETRATQTNVGCVRSLYDGVAKVDGLSNVMYNEMIEFPGNLYGIALSLEEDEVGVVLLGNHAHLKEGDEAKTTGKLLSVPVGKSLLGRVVDALGKPVDGKGTIESSEQFSIEKVAPGIIPRESVSQPLQTGIMSIDAMIPVGRGQRELIIGDRSTGKTTIAIDTIINQARINDAAKLSDGTWPETFRPVYSIYVAIGQKQSNIARTIGILEEAGALAYTIIVAAPAADSPASQYIAPFTGTAMGEYFMQNNMDALIVYDDLSKHAVAYRQISLVLKRPAGREAYPGDVFYLHSRLLERSARLNANNGGGSLTALPIIETQAGDVSAYIPTNVISITDGQIFLELDLFNQGVRPAVNVGLSVSRVGSAAQVKAIKQVAGKVKGQLAQYRELAAFAQFGSDLDAQTKSILDKGDRMVELFKQPPLSPIPTEIQVALIWAVQKDFLADISKERVAVAVRELREFLQTAESALVGLIGSKGQLDEALEEKLKAAVEKWKRSFSTDG